MTFYAPPPQDVSHPQQQQPKAARKKVTIQTLNNLRQSNTPITTLTAYDYPTALACSSSPLVDITLIGDSLAQVALGLPSTTHLTLSDMIHHARAVARGTTHPLLVADMPFGTYHASTDSTILNAVRLIQEAHIDAIKMEGGEEIAPLVTRLTGIGIPVMGHVGLLPQRHVALSGYKVQGRTADAARRVVRDALALQEAGAFSIVVEAVPKELGRYVTEKLRVPTIGIGAGPWTSGQVLVIDDALGSWAGHKPKFARRFAELKALRDGGVHRYAEAVRGGTFPDSFVESYAMAQEEWERFIKAETIVEEKQVKKD
ncbi:hypothetical protein AMATHDRAFT_81574 [Amanita thiersii Skay4041]|uniref:3-methyl-2-oxobutanoate hydroxymethyltransferase n=1 Tax=Amanita thiersii Skay4041 TaxID=703135 RepID=A0A2A9NE49_9AGAR|nr:hypothetical protein AMATHDRAFT_81574 [Amanita thiersii Skay4041]